MANEYYNVDPFVLWQEDHAWAHQPEFDVIDETIQGKLCQSSNSNLLSFLQLSLVIKPSPHCPVIPLSSHRLNWCQWAIMQSLQIPPCPTLKKLPCPPTFMRAWSTIRLSCELWCSQTLHISISTFLWMTTNVFLGGFIEAIDKAPGWRVILEDICQEYWYWLATVSPIPPEFFDLLKEALARHLFHPGFFLANSKFYPVGHTINLTLSSPRQAPQFNQHLHVIRQQGLCRGIQGCGASSLPT